MRYQVVYQLSGEKTNQKHALARAVLFLWHPADNIRKKEARVSSDTKTALGSLYGMTQWLVDKSFALAMVCLVLMVIPVTLDVVLRSITHVTIPGVIEMEEILMLMLVFLSLAGPQMSSGHIDVDLVFAHLPERVQRGLWVFHWSAALILIAMLTDEIFMGALEKLEQHEFTPELYIPTAPFHFVATAGLAVLCLALLCSLCRAVSACLKERYFLALLCGLVGTALLCSLPWLLENTELAWNYLLAGGTAFLFLVVLLLLRMPIGYTMSIVGVLGLMLINENHLSPLAMLGIGAPHTAMNFTMTVVPLFILMGELALYSGISSDLFDAASKWLGKMPGGLAIASVAGCTGFAAICGDSFATAMTMSSVALPEMKKHRYNNGLACATLASGGTLGILIPPSVGFIFYAIITEESLGKLFLAGVLPGLMLAAMFCIALYTIARLHPELAPRGEEYPLKEKLAALKGILPMLGLVVLVLGGILFGFFNPTEGGAIGAFGAFLYAVCTRKLTCASFFAALRSTVSMTTKLMFILIGVNLLGYFLAATQLPFALADLILGVTDNKYIVFALIVLLYIALGCMLNVIPMILLTLPAIYPTVQALGFDPIWFGVITVILMEMGQITPPMGLVVFAIAGMPEGAPMAHIFKYVSIFVLCMLAAVLVITIFPQIALFLPNTLL